MKLTNKHNIPEIIVRAVGESYPPTIGKVAVTSLIDAPLIRYLKIKHWDELEEDVSSKLWALLGTAAHTVTQRGAPHTAGVEQYMKLFVNDMAITGKSDIIMNDELIDIKVTSVYSFLLGEKDVWSKQLNVYNYMAFKLFNKRIKRACIYGILRDWQESKQYTQHDYPEIPFFEQEVALWPIEQTQQYIEKRVELHKMADQALTTDDAKLVPMFACGPADRWTKPTTFAVMQKGKKRALRVLDTHEEAVKWMVDGGKTGKSFYIQERPGASTRCERFCVCKPVCPVYKFMEKVEEAEE